MTDKRTKQNGLGRAAFLGKLEKIRAEIAAGDFLTTVHARHYAQIGISYSAFRKLVDRYASDVKPPRKPYGRPVIPPPRSLVTRDPATRSNTAPPLQRTFPDAVIPGPEKIWKYDPDEKPGDAERLLGPPAPKPPRRSRLP